MAIETGIETPDRTRAAVTAIVANVILEIVNFHNAMRSSFIKEPKVESRRRKLPALRNSPVGLCPALVPGAGQGPDVHPCLGLVPVALIRALKSRGFVPQELRSKDEFTKLLEKAEEVRVARHGDEAKLKLRTRDALYTFKTTTEEADSLVKGIKAPVVEF